MGIVLFYGNLFISFKIRSRFAGGIFRLFIENKESCRGTSLDVIHSLNEDSSGNLGVVNHPTHNDSSRVHKSDCCSGSPFRYYSSVKHCSGSVGVSVDNAIDPIE
jgi:hypothetical protein